MNFRLIHFIKRKLIQLLGGIEKQEHMHVLDKCQSELNDYKVFATSLYNYYGSYPAWKAQQEYRELLSNKGIALTRRVLQSPDKLKSCTHEEYIDIYLGRIVDAFTKMVRMYPTHFKGDHHYWYEEKLSSARGNDYLKKESLE